MLRNIEKTLVSICVVSYNSAKTILQTLESIKNQTYKNIELIISDDNSRDETVEIAESWIKENSEYFYNCQLITVETNSGVTGNCNRAIKKSYGSLVKVFAADDVLYPDYVENCVKHFNSNPNCSVLFTRLTPFLDNDFSNHADIPEDYNFFKLSQEEQKKFVLKNGLTILPTPACIYRREVFDKIGFFDEEIPMWEDGPMYFRLAENDIKMHLLDVDGVYYRISSSSLSNKRPVSHIKSISKFYFKYRLKYEIKLSPFKAIFHIIKFFFGSHYNLKLCKLLYNLTELHAFKGIK